MSDRKSRALSRGLSCGVGETRGRGNSLQAVVLVLDRLRVITGAISIGGGSGGGGGGSGTAGWLFFSDECADTNTLSSELNELRMGWSTWGGCGWCWDVCLMFLIVVQMDSWWYLVGGS